MFYMFCMVFNMSKTKLTHFARGVETSDTGPSRPDC